MKAQTLISLACMLLAILAFRRASLTGRHGRSGWVFAPLLLGFGLFMGALLGADYFTNRGIDESVIYHLRFGLDGAGFGEYTVLVLALTCVIAVSLWMAWLVTRWSASSPARRPAHAGWASVLLAALSIGLSPVSATVSQWATEPQTDLAFADYYRPTPSVPIRQPRNMLVIYLEGLESTYLDEGEFPGLSPRLNQWKHKGAWYTDIDQTRYAGWTIAGMIASQCGLPLVSPSSGNSLFGLDRFLPAERCLGDVLHEAGYAVEFMGGASLDFAGKGKFLMSHGFESVWGREHWRETLPATTPMSSWGIFDDMLLEQLHARLQVLSGQDQPFALFSLTLDTHHPRGHASPACGRFPYQQGDNSLLNAVHCTDRLVGSLLDRILAPDSGMDLLVVLLSDHLSQKNLVWDRLQRNERRNFLLILDSRNLQGTVTETGGTTLDIAPVILDRLGQDLDMGFGRNIHRRPSVSRTVAGFNEAIKAWKAPFETLWQFPRLDAGIQIDPVGTFVKIKDRRFEVPVIVEFDPALKTRLYFEFYGDTTSKTLRDYYAVTELESGLIWVDRCDRIRRDNAFSEESLCLLLGSKRAGRFEIDELTATREISRQQLEQVFE